ncbi:MAG: hypothetical protein R6V05_01840 [Candidatus Brocadiia bacterium]
MAKQFPFRFQKILDVREQQQKGLEIELARLDRAILRQEERRRHWELAREQALQDLALARREGDMSRSSQCADYIRHVRSRIAGCTDRAEELRDERARVQAELAEKMRSCKLLENYRDRLKRELMAEHEKAEQKVLDLHSANTFSRAKSG